MAFSIDNIWAYIAVNEDGEGITSMFHENAGWMAMVGADQERMDSLREHAQAMANQSGRRIVLARFSVREDLEVIEPDGTPPDPFVKIV